MKFRKTRALFILMGCTFGLASYTVYKSSGAHPGSTGAPKDMTCAQHSCHTDAQVTINPAGTNTLVFSSPDSSYVGGQTYSITIKVQKPGTVRFGFEVQAIRDSDSSNIGQFMITDGVRTHLINHLVPPADTRYSVTHSTDGTAALFTDATEWTMNWQAPPSNEGDITFYYATNCTNNSGDNLGDKIYLSSFKIHPKVTSVKELSDVHELKLFYDHEAKALNITYDTKGNKKTALKVFDMAGKLIFESPATKTSGVQKQSIFLGNGHAKGTYMVSLTVDEQQASKKVIVY